MAAEPTLSVDCVLFDLDGTLINTAPDFLEATLEICEHNNFPVPPNALLTENVSNGAGALIDLILTSNDRDIDKEDLLQIFLKTYLNVLAHTKSHLYPSYDQLLEDLDKQQIPWGIVTNKPLLYAETLLKALALRSRCSVLICPEDVVEKKPSPEPINLALKTLGCSSHRSVYIGDHERDIQSAKNANVIAVAAAYGYIPKDIKIEDWGADFILTSSTGLSNFLNFLHFS